MYSFLKRQCDESDNMFPVRIIRMIEYQLLDSNSWGRLVHSCMGCGFLRSICPATVGNGIHDHIGLNRAFLIAVF